MTRYWLRPLAIALLSAPLPVLGAGDLLVAPTRIVLDRARGTEVILNNMGNAPATYRISLELKRMRPDGTLEDIAADAANPTEAAALAMISYAPRRVTLPPNQPQAIRIGIRAPAGLADGEYRAHMLFRAIPEARPVVEPQPREGLSIALTPIYGVTIPIIVRRGNLAATAAISNVRVEQGDGKEPELTFSLARRGDRSVYGRIRVLKAGAAKPLYEARGIAVYAETGMRTVALPLLPEVAQTMRGAITVQYLEDFEAGGGLIAEAKADLR